MKQTILTVINQFNTQMVIDSFLGDEVHVVNCDNGFEALSWLHNGQTADLLVVDMDMPMLNGYDLTDSIRKMKGMYDVPVVMISSRQINLQRNKSFRIQDDNYLQKPISPQQLLNRITENLRFVKVH